MFEFKVTGDKLFTENVKSLVSGSKGYYTAKFVFDSDWEGLSKHIVVCENGVKRADALLNDNTHMIATTESGIMSISVYGIDANKEKCISTNYVHIKVQKGAYTGVPSLPKDIWEGYQITVLGYVERAEFAADSAKTDAETVKFNLTLSEMFKNECSAFSDSTNKVSEETIKKADSIKNMTVEAISGAEASVTISETEEGLHLDFILPKGEQGEKGDTGNPGADGYTPVRGTDYWTEADKAEIKSYVDEAILGGVW